MYRPTGKEARRQACWRKPCHTWQDTSAQAWHPLSRVTACGVTVGPTQMGRPGGSQVRAGWPDPRAHPLVTTTTQKWWQRPCSSVNSTNVRSSPKPLLPNRTHSVTFEWHTLLRNNSKHLGKWKAVFVWGFRQINKQNRSGKNEKYRGWKSYINQSKNKQ